MQCASLVKTALQRNSPFYNKPFFIERKVFQKENKKKCPKRENACQEYKEKIRWKANTNPCKVDRETAQPFWRLMLQRIPCCHASWNANTNANMIDGKYKEKIQKYKCTDNHYEGCNTHLIHFHPIIQIERCKWKCNWHTRKDKSYTYTMNMEDRIWI